MVAATAVAIAHVTWVVFHAILLARAPLGRTSTGWMLSATAAARAKVLHTSRIRCRTRHGKFPREKRPRGNFRRLARPRVQRPRCMRRQALRQQLAHRAASTQRKGEWTVAAIMRVRHVCCPRLPKVQRVHLLCVLR